MKKHKTYKTDNNNRKAKTYYFEERKPLVYVETQTESKTEHNDETDNSKEHLINSILETLSGLIDALTN